MDELKTNKPKMSLIEGVRKRPGMYFGGIDTTAYYYAIFWAIESYLFRPTAVSPFKLRIVLHTDNSVSIEEDKELFEFADGELPKQFEESSRHELAIVRAASSWMNVDIWQERQHYQFKFTEGQLVESTTKQINKARRGSRVRFLLDPNIFERAERRIYFHRVIGRARSWAACLPGVHLQIVSEVDNRVSDVQFNHGLSDYLAEYLDGLGGWLGTSFHSPLLIDHKNEHGRVSLAISWVNMSITSPTIFAFINGNRNHTWGVHIDALQSSLYKIAKDEYKKTRWTEGYTVTEDSVFEGLVCGMSLWLDNMQIGDFGDAIGAKLISLNAQQLVEQAILENLPAIFADDLECRDRFISRAAIRINDN